MAEITNVLPLFGNQRHYDAVLFALLDDARKAVDDYVIARDAAYEARERADADPDSPDGITASTAAEYAHWERHGYNEKSEAWNHAHMRAQGALLTAFRVRAATIEGALAKVKYVLEFETKVGKDEDPETWWFTHEWLDELQGGSLRYARNRARVNVIRPAFTA